MGGDQLGSAMGGEYQGFVNNPSSGGGARIKGKYWIPTQGKAIKAWLKIIYRECYVALLYDILKYDMQADTMKQDVYKLYDKQKLPHNF